MKDQLLSLREKCGEIEIKSELSFAAVSSIGCGGVARAAFYPKDTAQLIALLDLLRREKIKFCVLGKMTNVLPPEGAYDGAAIFTERLKTIAVGQSVFVGSGVTSKALLDVCARRGLTGAEFLAGIPCSIGGAVFMNAGAGGKHISDILESALVYRYRDGKTERVLLEECGYGYKQSVFMQGGSAILGATFHLEQATSEEVAKKRERALAARKHLPKGKSMGCVFKNPPNDFAGKLIDDAGLKGLRVGGAIISENHANFILNTGGATVADIKTLIERAKNSVCEKFGVELEEEIRYL